MFQCYNVTVLQYFNVTMLQSAQPAEDWSECALFLPRPPISQLLNGQSGKKRARRQEGGSKRAGGNKHGRGGVMRELALTCQGRVPPTIPYNAMLALYESLAMFRNLPLASGSQLFQLFVSTYFWFRRCYHLFWMLGSGNIVVGTFSAKMWFANNVNLQLKTVLRLTLTSYFHDDPPLIPT